MKTRAEQQAIGGFIQAMENHPSMKSERSFIQAVHTAATIEDYSACITALIRAINAYVAEFMKERAKCILMGILIPPDEITTKALLQQTEFSNDAPLTMLARRFWMVDTWEDILGH